MPYKLRKAPNRNLYWVVTIETGKKHSKDPIPLDKAKAQMRVLESALIGGKSCEKPPYHDYSKGKASAFVLGCIDPRYAYDVAFFLQHKKELHQDYDLFTLPGASLGADQKGLKKTFFDVLKLGLDLHGIKEVWCFDHLDCGMYKATFNLKTDMDPKIHIKCMDKLKKEIKKKYPQLKFREFIVDAKGHIKEL